jgi:CubicO group peptidase (beta-lactamase class C family)
MKIGILLCLCIIFLAGCDKGNNKALEIDETKDAIILNEDSDFEQLVDKSADLAKFQGSILIAYNDEIVLAKGYGFADEEKQLNNTMNTTYEIGSVTKQFTAAAIMQLSEKGKLSVDDTIDKYFPDYVYGDKITIKNLLQMRSGIYDFVNAPKDFFSDDFLKKFKTDKDMVESNLDPNDFLKYLYSAKLKFEPDSKFEYSNSNYFILGLIIEKVTGTSYKEYIQSYIFKPCNMNSSNMDFQQTDAIGYSSSGYLSFDPSITFSAGSICSNVIDLFKWDEALINKQVVSETSFEEMIDAKDGYGYGIGNRSNVLDHDGKTLCFIASNKIDLNNNIIIIAMTNKIDNTNSFNRFLQDIEIKAYKALLEMN